MKRFYLAVLIASGLAFPVRELNAQSGMPHAGSSSKATPAAGTGKYGESGFEKAQQITKEEAMKKYPPPRGGYPTADITEGPHQGVSHTLIKSPYPPHHRFDASAVPEGGLILDPYAKHVFIKP